MRIRTWGDVAIRSCRHECSENAALSPLRSNATSLTIHGPVIPSRIQVTDFTPQVAIHCRDSGCQRIGRNRTGIDAISGTAQTCPLPWQGSCRHRAAQADTRVLRLGQTRISANCLQAGQDWGLLPARPWRRMNPTAPAATQRDPLARQTSGKERRRRGLDAPGQGGGHRFRFLAHGQAKRMCLCPRRCGGCAPRHPAAMVTLTTALSGLQDPIPSKADRLLADQTRKRHGSTASCRCVSCAEEFLPQRRSEPLSGARCLHLPRRAKKHSQAGRASLSP